MRASHLSPWSQDSQNHRFPLRSARFVALRVEEEFPAPSLLLVHWVCLALCRALKCVRALSRAHLHAHPAAPVAQRMLGTPTWPRHLREQTLSFLTHELGLRRRDIAGTPVAARLASISCNAALPCDLPVVWSVCVVVAARDLQRGRPRASACMRATENSDSMPRTRRPAQFGRCSRGRELYRWRDPMIQPDSWHGMQLAAGALCRVLATAFMAPSVRCGVVKSV